MTQQRSSNLQLHEKVRDLKYNTFIPKDYLHRATKILQISSHERTLDDIALLLNITKDFSFFWKLYEDDSPSSVHTHEECCRSLQLETFSKGTVIFRQGDDGDKMYFILSGELDVYITNSGLEGFDNTRQKTQQDQSSNSSSRQVVRSRSPSKPTAPLSNKDSSLNSLHFEDDSSNHVQPVLITQGDHNESGKSASKPEYKDARYYNPFNKTRKVKMRHNSIVNVPNQLIDIKELMYHTNLEPFRGKDGLLWDGIFGLKYLNTIKSGAVFGEMALTTGRKRAATIIAMEDCILASLGREEFKRILQFIEKKNLRIALDFLGKALSITLSQETMIKLSGMFQEEKIKYRHTLFKEGDSAEGFYVVKSGEVLIYKIMSYPIENMREREMNRIQKRFTAQIKDTLGLKPQKMLEIKFPIRTILQGQLVGNEILIGVDSREYSAECKKEGSLLYVPYEKFQRFVSRLGDAKQALMEKTAQSFNWIQQRLADSHKYLDYLAESSKSRSPSAHSLTYDPRVSMDKVAPLYEKLTARERSLTPELPRNTSYSNFDLQDTTMMTTKMPSLSPIKTPEAAGFVNESSNVETPFVRLTKRELTPPKHPEDLLQHLNEINEGILIDLLRGSEPEDDPFVLREFPFFDAKKRALAYKKNKYITPEDIKRHLAQSISPTKHHQKAFQESLKDLNKQKKDNFKSKRFSHLSRHFQKQGNVQNPELYASELNLENFIAGGGTPIKENQKSHSTPILPKGSLMTLFWLKGMKQLKTPNIKPYISSRSFSKPQSASSTDAVVGSNVGSNIDIKTSSSFHKWSEKEVNPSYVRLNSERLSTPSGIEETGNNSLGFQLTRTEEKMPVTPPKPTIQSEKSNEEGTMKRVTWPLNKPLRQYNQIERLPTEINMQVIEEEKPSGPSQFSSTIKDHKNNDTKDREEHKIQLKKEFKDENNMQIMGAIAPPTGLRSSNHNLFRFVNTPGTRRGRRYSKGRAPTQTT